MSAPVWEPGKVYLTGALVRPTTTTPVTTGTITNASFEDGDQDWDKSGGATIVNTPGFDGAWCARITGSNGAVVSQDRLPCSPGQSISASCMGRMPTGSPGTGFDCNINWYDASGALIGTAEGTTLIRKDGTNWRKSTVTGVAPAGAAFFTVRGDGNVAVGGEILLDTFRLDSYVFTTPPPGLVYKAVQPDPGTSDTTEPTWPLVLGQQVVDNTVTWEAVATRRVTWKAIPTMKSGATEPDWPTAPGGTVLDGTIIWTASSRRVEDERCPNSKVVTIAASKIFAVDKDIVAYSATVNPLDWSSRDNAGYLPTGLQQYGANDMAVLGLYGSNLMAFNSQGFQMWQVDEDPANMSLLDARPIGSTFPKAIAPVANDLFFLTELGVRTVGIAGGSTNLQASDAGAPIDPLVQEALPLSPDPIAMFYPSLGQYWLMMREPEPSPWLSIQDFPCPLFNVPYEVQIVAQYGKAPYTFSHEGTLPTGMSLTSSGILFGTPTEEGVFNYTIVVTDSDGDIAYRNKVCSIVFSKFYFEVRMDSLRNGSPFVGIADIAIDATVGSSVSRGALGWSLQWNNTYSNWIILNSNSGSSGNGSGTITPKSSPFVVGCAVDLANGKIWWSVDGEWLGGGNPETGANPNWDDAFAGFGQNKISGRTVKACVGVIASDGVATAKFIEADLTYPTPNGFSNINTSQDGSVLTFDPLPSPTRVVLSNGNMTVAGNGINDGIRLSTWSRS